MKSKMDLAVFEISERLSDESDLASRGAEQIAAIELESQRRRANRPLHPDFDGENCIECGYEIAPARLAVVHTDLCIECANFLDKVKSIYHKDSATQRLSMGQIIAKRNSIEEEKEIERDETDRKARKGRKSLLMD